MGSKVEEAWQAELAAIEKAVEDAQDDFSVPKLSVKVYDYDYVGEHDEVGYRRQFLVQEGRNKGEKGKVGPQGSQA